MFSLGTDAIVSSLLNLWQKRNRMVHNHERMTTLIVDDDDLFRDLWLNEPVSEGLDVHCGHDGKSATP
jgi:hypothetical protein